MQSEIIRQIVREEVRRKIKTQRQLVEHRKNVRSCVKFLDLVIEEQKDRDLIKEFAGLEGIASGLSTFVSGFFENIPEGGKNLIYEQVTGFILDSIAKGLGIPEVATDSVFGSFLRNFIPEFAERDGIDKITRFISTKDPAACKDIVSAVFVGFMETGAEKIFYERVLPEMFNTVTRVIFQSPNTTFDSMSGRTTNIVGSFARETVNEFLEKYLESMIGPVSDFLCVHQDAEKLKNEIMGMMNLSPSSDTNGSPGAKGAKSSGVKSSGVKKYSDEDLAKMINTGRV